MIPEWHSLPLFGGPLLVDPTKPLAFESMALSNGAGSVALAIPDNPNLAGIAIYCQALGATRPGPQWSFTNGLEVRICP